MNCLLGVFKVMYFFCVLGICSGGENFEVIYWFKKLVLYIKCLSFVGFLVFIRFSMLIFFGLCILWLL